MTNAVSTVGMIICGAFFAVVTVFLYYYAFRNPDPKSCWVVRDLDSAALTKDAIVKKAGDMGVEVTPGFPIEMSKLYRTWFAWGFWANVISTGASILSWVVQVTCSEKLGLIGKAVFGCGYCINMIVWMSFGIVWRFSKGGKVAAGDKLERLDS